MIDSACKVTLVILDIQMARLLTFHTYLPSHHINKHLTAATGTYCRVKPKHSNLNFGQNWDNNSLVYYYTVSQKKDPDIIDCNLKGINGF